mmetsp:Transcript_3473/g.3824  ORF Transcript_3473/g.3824 Transcript_3473/m.3824 type:complete len:200 (+) Transcript_3473:167-766(+)
MEIVGKTLLTWKGKMGSRRCTFVEYKRRRTILPKKIKIKAKPSGIISQTLYRFGIDGPLLLTFEMEDFHYTGITKPVHKLQILLDLKCRSFSKHHKPLDCDLRRRDRFRKHFRLVSAARSLLKKIRLRLSIKNTKNHPVKNAQVHFIGDIDVRLRGGWWSDQTRDYIEPPGKRFGKRGPNEVKGMNQWKFDFLYRTHAS